MRIFGRRGQQAQGTDRVGRTEQRRQPSKPTTLTAGQGPTEVPPPKGPHLMARLFGTPNLRKSVVASVAGVSFLLGSCAAFAQGHELNAPDPTNTRQERVVAHRYQEALDALNERLRRGAISIIEYNAAKGRLERDEVTMDHRGRVDVDVLILGAVEGTSRGQQVMDQLARSLEQRMRVTARDMANPNTVFVEGSQGRYKEIDPDIVKDLIVDALQDMPLDDLPLGGEVTRFIRGLPVGHGVHGGMSFNEIEDHLGDELEARFKDRFGPFFEKHRVETAVVALATISGIRAASPDAARLIDAMSPRVTIWKDQNADGSLYGKARLAYRDQNVFPQLDLTATAQTTVSLVDLRAQATATIAPENEDILDGRFSLGAHYHQGNIWADTSATYWVPDERTRLNATLGGYAPNRDLSFSTSLTATFEPNQDDRFQLDFDVGKPVQFGRAQGNFEAYLGAEQVGSDTGVVGGIVLQLNF